MRREQLVAGAIYADRTGRYFREIVSVGDGWISYRTWTAGSARPGPRAPIRQTTVKAFAAFAAKEVNQG